jgi:hypothetical protein
MGRSALAEVFGRVPGVRLGGRCIRLWSVT